MKTLIDEENTELYSTEGEELYTGSCIVQVCQLCFSRSVDESSVRSHRSVQRLYCPAL